MKVDFLPGRIGLSTLMRLGIARIIAKILTQTMARKEEASSFSSMTIKTIPELARPKVRSNTHRMTSACLSETQPQQHEFATLIHLRKFGSSAFFWASSSLASSSSLITGAGLIGENSCVSSIRCYSQVSLS